MVQPTMYIMFTTLTLFLVASYEWSPSNMRSQPSSYLQDLLAYLQGAFIAFEQLTVNTAHLSFVLSEKMIFNSLIDILEIFSLPTVKINYEFPEELVRSKCRVATRP